MCRLLLVATHQRSRHCIETLESNLACFSALALQHNPNRFDTCSMQNRFHHLSVRDAKCCKANTQCALLDRRGSATVEMAIITPLILLITLGTLDICSMIFLKEAATLAAYEGARSGIEKGKTNDDAIKSALEFLNARDIKYSPSKCIKISQPGYDHADTLQHVSITVTLPIRGNLLLAPQVIKNLNLSAKVTMRKEYENAPEP